MPVADPIDAVTLTGDFLRDASRDDLLDRLQQLAVSADHIASLRSSILSELDRRLELGLISDREERNGWQYQWSPGRRSYTFPEPILNLERKLKEAKEAAIATGEAVEKTGKPFWTVRRGKEA